MSAKAILVSLILALAGISSVHASDRPNVLFLAVDDLRPEFNAYGVEQIHSPSMDRLAASGVIFDAAYCNAPQCGPSRASVMTGLRPNRTRFFGNQGRTPLGDVDKEARGIPTLPHLFKSAGYQTACLGKVYHHFGMDPESWTVPPWRVGEGSDWHRIPENFNTAAGRAALVEKTARNPGTSLPWEAADVPDDAYPDGQAALKAIELLQQFKNDGEPFFLAVGFLRPHLPLTAPQKYWDLYPESSITLPEHMEMPEGAPPEAAYNWGELRRYVGIPKKGPLSPQQARTLIRAYYACVSYVDAQVGKVLEELERLGLAENTVVVLWGDHGWNLGEHGLWCKHTTFETSMRVPLIFAGPGVASGRSEALVELVDLYPTLLQMSGIEVPRHNEGTSLVPLLRDPTHPGDEAAVGYWRQGDTVKTVDHRLTVWPDKPNRPGSEMLFDHRNDPEEMKNIANDPEQADLIQQLRRHIPLFF